MSPKKVLTVAGSDCSGGAGIQADLKTFQERDVYGMVAVTCLVAMVPENWHHIVTPVDTDMIEKHFDTTNPWDQSVLAAIMTNVLAYVEVQAEQDGVNMERAMKDFYELNLVDYRNQVKENLKKVSK